MNLITDIDQLTRILEVIGTPDQEFLDKITSDTVSVYLMSETRYTYVITVVILFQAKTFIQSMPHYPRKDFSTYFVGNSSEAVDLLGKLLHIDPDRRPSAEEALAHPYLASYADPEDEVNIVYTD